MLTLLDKLNVGLRNNLEKNIEKREAAFQKEATEKTNLAIRASLQLAPEDCTALIEKCVQKLSTKSKSKSKEQSNSSV